MFSPCYPLFLSFLIDLGQHCSEHNFQFFTITFWHEIVVFTAYLTCTVCNCIDNLTEAPKLVKRQHRRWVAGLKPWDLIMAQIKKSTSLGVDIIEHGKLLHRSWAYLRMYVCDLFILVSRPGLQINIYNIVQIISSNLSPKHANSWNWWVIPELTCWEDTGLTDNMVESEIKDTSWKQGREGKKERE